MRQPLNVHVFIFRRTGLEPEYLLLRRSDDGNWQGVAGGVEEGESVVEAARREQGLGKVPDCLVQGLVMPSKGQDMGDVAGGGA